VFGDFEGKITEAVQKLNALHNSKNGPFSFAVLLGSLTNVDPAELDSFLSGNIPLDLPIYVHGAEISTKLSNLNVMSETCVSAEGFRIAHSSTSQGGSEELVDILVSDRWPLDVERFTNATSTIPEFENIDKDADTKRIAKALSPRYHFTSGNDIFWERAPYRNSSGRITRFISLGNYGGSKKWFYAFKLGPQHQSQDLPDTTENPYEAREIKRKLVDDNNELNNSPEFKQIQPRKKRERLPKVRPDACFFCLSNPKLDKDLIISIAEESYLALDKGPLSTPQIKSKLGFNGHILFIPIGHIPTLSFLPKEARDMIGLEHKKYLIGLERMFNDHGLQMATFEISRSKGIHLHTQVIPILAEQVDNIEKSIQKEVQAVGLKVEARDVKKEEGDYVRFEVDKRVFVVSFQNYREKFDFQLCRRAIALGMNEPDKIDWKFCVRSPQEEAKEAAQFKKEFAQYDFSL
jgi:diadenosine tetraphosphate (Ap4A) HIT family hydrolase